MVNARKRKDAEREYLERKARRRGDKIKEKKKRPFFERVEAWILAFVGAVALFFICFFVYNLYTAPDELTIKSPFEGYTHTPLPPLKPIK